jgi:hypothetical protein
MQNAEITNPLYVICGHYGAGKTNLALNIARNSRARYQRLTLVDLDVVNPYFRSTDYREFVEALGIRLIGPVYGGSNLDTPSLSPGIDTAVREASQSHAVIIDVGGDPDGARALARFAGDFFGREQIPQYELAFVCNFKRPDTATVDANIALIKEIEQTSKLKVTKVIGNTHLKASTSPQDIACATTLTVELAERLGVELAGITAPRDLAADAQELLTADPQTANITVLPIDILVGTNWELYDS